MHRIPMPESAPIQPVHSLQRPKSSYQVSFFSSFKYMSIRSNLFAHVVAPRTEILSLNLSAISAARFASLAVLKSSRILTQERLSCLQIFVVFGLKVCRMPASLLGIAPQANPLRTKRLRLKAALRAFRFKSRQPPVRRFTLLALVLVCTAALCLINLKRAQTQSNLRRITNTTEEGININPSISGDGRIVAFESTEDIAGAAGSDHFRAIRANIAVDPATFFQIGGTRAVAPAISQEGSRIAFASKDDPLGTNADGNSEIFLFDDAGLTQITKTLPGDLAARVTNGNFAPSISDDGRFIAFSSNRDLTGQNADGNLEVFIYDTIAHNFIQLTNTTGIVGSSDAKISGNGASIAFIRDN